MTEAWQFIAPLYSALASLLLGFLLGRLKKIRSTATAEREALGALLRHDMFEIYETYRDAEEVPVRSQEEMASLYAAYHGLGFNHTGTKIHDEIMHKPTKV